MHVVAKIWLDHLSRLLHSIGFIRLWIKFRRSVFRRYGIYMLSYHHVTSGPDDPLGHRVSAEQFEAHVRYLKKWSEIIPLKEALEHLSKPPLKRDYLVITFDDGYKDVHKVAFPILRKLGVPATVFLIAGLVGENEVPWYDECKDYLRILAGTDQTDARAESLTTHLSSIQDILREPGPLEGKVERATDFLKTVDDRSRLETMRLLRSQYQLTVSNTTTSHLMNWEQARKMAAQGIAFGSHTVTHPILTKLNLTQVEQELGNSKKIIEENLGVPCHFFAFPNGDFNQETIETLKRLGYVCACTQTFGSNQNGTDLFRLKRIGVGNISCFTLAAKLSGILSPVFMVRRLLVKYHSWTIALNMPSSVSVKVKHHHKSLDSRNHGNSPSLEPKVFE